MERFIKLTKDVNNTKEIVYVDPLHITALSPRDNNTYHSMFAGYGASNNKTNIYLTHGSLEVLQTVEEIRKIMHDHEFNNKMDGMLKNE